MAGKVGRRAGPGQGQQRARVHTEQSELGWLAEELRIPRRFWSMTKPWGRRADCCVELKLS